MPELIDLICEKCNAPFKGTQNMKYCPRCRFIKYDYKEGRSVVGETIKCKSCGKEFIFTGGYQSLCKDCQPEVMKQNKMKANAKFQKKKYDSIIFRVPKGDKTKYADHAEKMNLSLNQFIVNSMNNQIDLDNKKEASED